MSLSELSYFGLIRQNLHFAKSQNYNVGINHSIPEGKSIWQWTQ